MTATPGNHPNAPADPPMGPASLNAPWRQAYVENVDSKPATPSHAAPSTGSFLADNWLSPDQDIANHVIARSAKGLILLNRFPYTGGHLLVALGDPRPSLLDYHADDRAHLWALVDAATMIVQHALAPQGINIGLNQGRAAGAGLPQHLHVHLVPRWSGDVNFLTTVGQIRVIPTALESMAARYRSTVAALALPLLTPPSPAPPQARG